MQIYPTTIYEFHLTALFFRFVSPEARRRSHAWLRGWHTKKIDIFKELAPRPRTYELHGQGKKKRNGQNQDKQTPHTVLQKLSPKACTTPLSIKLKLRGWYTKKIEIFKELAPRPQTYELRGQGEKNGQNQDKQTPHTVLQKLSPKACTSPLN